MTTSNKHTDRDSTTAAERLPCGCWHQPCPKHDAQIAFDEIDHNAECLRAVLRKVEYDDDVRAAGEALGFFIYKARKEASK